MSLGQARTSIEHARPAPAPAVLLLHGFTASPGELEELGQVLFDAGYHVKLPLLPGHGTNLQEFERATHAEWIQTAVSEAAQLTKSHPVCFVVGLSMGALLSLFVATRVPQIRALVLISPPYWLQTRGRDLLLRLLDRADLWNLLPTFLPKRDPLEPLAIPRFAYDGYPRASLRELLHLTGKARTEVQQVKQPTLWIHSKTDQAAPFDSSARFRALLPTDSLFFPLDHGNHVLTCDKQREVVFHAVNRFLASYHFSTKKGLAA